MQLKSPGISSVVMLTGEKSFMFTKNSKILLNSRVLYPLDILSFCYLILCRKYKLEEVNKHELLKCHCNCVRFIKAWEERLVK